MHKNNLLTISILLCLSTFASVVPSQVAVCIGGQLPRLQPQLLSPLFTANTQFHFTLFYSLQYSVESTKAKFWSDDQFVFDPSQVGKLNRDKVEQALRSIYKPHENVDIASVQFGLGLSAQQWSERYFNGSALSAIQLPVAVPEIVLNMLSKQTDCVEQIMEHEQKLQTKFDYVIWGREDLHFYKPFDLHNLTSYLQPAPHSADNVTSADGLITKRSHPHQPCQLLIRNCLTHGGLSLRGYIWTRDIAVPTMLYRMDFYRYLLRRNERVITVEAFEQSLMLHRNISVCSVNKDYFATVAVRHTVNGGFCIPPLETNKRCFVTGMESYVNKHKCNRATIQQVQKYRNRYSKHILYRTRKRTFTLNL